MDGIKDMFLGSVTRKIFNKILDGTVASDKIEIVIDAETGKKIYRVTIERKDEWGDPESTSILEFRNKFLKQLRTDMETTFAAIADQYNVDHAALESMIALLKE